MKLVGVSILAAGLATGCGGGNWGGGTWGGVTTSPPPSVAEYGNYENQPISSASNATMSRSPTSRMSMPATPTRTMDGVLVGPNDMALYTFSRDTAYSGKSMCNDSCKVNWPPLMASDTAMPMGNYSVVTRDDGKKQWAYKGQPLYYWSKDTKAGDRTGDGVGGAWKLARP